MQRKVTISLELTNDIDDKMLSDDEVHELMCRIVHEEDVEALAELHSYVTDIEVV